MTVCTICETLFNESL